MVRTVYASSAVAFVPLMIRWGADASSDKLRHSARCTVCGHKAATLQHPGWIDAQAGFAPFAADMLFDESAFHPLIASGCVQESKSGRGRLAEDCYWDPRFVSDRHDHRS